MARIMMMPTFSAPPLPELARQQQAASRVADSGQRHGQPRAVPGIKGATQVRREHVNYPRPTIADAS